MRFAVNAAAISLVIGLSSVSAFAKAPKDAPSVEEIFQQATKALEEKTKAEIEKSKDPLKEAIEAYRDRKAPLPDFQKLVDCLNDAKTDAVQPYRADAAQALVARFAREDENDPQNRAIRRQIALGILDLMKAPQKDEIGLRSIETILLAWWRARLSVDIKFKATDKLDDRKKAYAKMKKFLDKGEN
jgi:hypothetical protein